MRRDRDLGHAGRSGRRVDHRSLGLDLRILAATVLKVLRREGISQKEHATMPEFMGAAAAEPTRARETA